MPESRLAWHLHRLNKRFECNKINGLLKCLLQFDVKRAKPDPEVFTQGAERLGIAYEDCAVFEDSLAGLQAAKSVNMLAVGIGTRENLPVADVIYPSLKEFEVEKFF